MGQDSESGESAVVKSLRKSHNELQEQLEETESDVERAHIRGQRHGLLKAIAVCHHQNTDGSDERIGTVRTTDSGELKMVDTPKRKDEIPDPE